MRIEFGSCNLISGIIDIKEVYTKVKETLVYSLPANTDIVITTHLLLLNSGCDMLFLSILVLNYVYV